MEAPLRVSVRRLQKEGTPPNCSLAVMGYQVDDVIFWPHGIEAERFDSV